MWSRCCCALCVLPTVFFAQPTSVAMVAYRQTLPTQATDLCSSLQRNHSSNRFRMGYFAGSVVGYFLKNAGQRSANISFQLPLTLSIRKNAESRGMRWARGECECLIGRIGRDALRSAEPDSSLRRVSPKVTGTPRSVTRPLGAIVLMGKVSWGCEF